MAGGVNFQLLSTTLLKTVLDSEGSLVASLQNGNANMTSQEFLKMQLDFAQNSLCTNTASSIIKERTDLWKGVVQKF
ncbi:MAG: hypothetical protein V4787_19505 [Pseudomonadota bacterium]